MSEIFEKVQPMLDQMTRDAIGESPSVEDAIEFANAIVSRAAGMVYASVHPAADRHAAVAMWLRFWVGSAEARSAMIEPRNVRH